MDFRKPSASLAPRAAPLLEGPPRLERPESLNRAMPVIREANGAEFLKDHLQVCLKVGLQKRRQPMQ